MIMESSGGRKRVGIIGYGVSGLIAVKCCLDEGLEPVCLERTDRIGGLWHYTDTATDGQACVMKSTVINTSKEMMSFSDFPIPDDFPNYMHNTKVIEYFKMYEKHFDLQKHVLYKQEVLSCKQGDDFPTTGQWKVKVKDHMNGGVEREETFDAILMCTGHHADKNIAVFPGQEEFQGNIVHTHDYKNHMGYEDKRVIIVGIGNSGVDVAVELSNICKQVYLSTRRGAWINTRFADGGLPWDMKFISRSSQLIEDTLPTSWFDSAAARELNKRFDHALYGLKPDFGLSEAHPTINDDLPNRIVSGSVIVKPNIQSFTKTGVLFDDGTFADNIDAVIMATGYKFGFPYLQPGIADVINNKVEMFKYVFPPDLSPPTLAVIGCFQPLGAIMPISELQLRWATRVFKGVASLPPRHVMWKDIRSTRDEMANRYIGSPRHTIQVDWIPFMDQIGSLVGCKPNLWKMMLTDPWLALVCFFGPCTPYQFRLQGPLPWKGARKAILSQWERVEAPLRTRRVAVDKPTYFCKIAIVGIMLAVVFVCITQCA